MALERALLSIESRQFVGRVAQRRTLRDMARLSGNTPVAVYVHGPREIGKSALLRAFLRENARPGVLLLGQEAAQGAQVILELLAERLSRVGAQARPTLASVRGAIAGLARHGGLILGVDGYDELGAAERWLREDILYRVPAGALIVLCGRTPPTYLWPGERVWRAFVRTLPLSELPFEEADALLVHQGVSQPHLRRAAYETVGGWPKSLLAAADALQEGRQYAPAEAVGRVIEQVLHPGSRRLEWRAGGSPGDEVVAAVAALPIVRRDVVRAAVGGDAFEAGWGALARIAHPAPDGYEIPCRLRAALEREATRMRPWQVRRWREAALEAAVAKVAPRGPTLPSSDWQEIHSLALRAPWYAALHPPAERDGGWRVLRGTLGSDGPDRLPGIAPWEQAYCRQVAARVPEALWLMRQNDGRIAAWQVWLPIARSGLLAQHPRTKTLLASLPRVPSHGLALAAWGARQDARGSAAVLLREALIDWPSWRRVYAQTAALRGAHGEDPLQLLGFRPLSESLDWSALDVPHHARQFAERLCRPQRAASPADRERRQAVKEALSQIFLGDLQGTTLDGFLRARDGEDADAAAYLLDALRSADLGRSHHGRRILTLYYVERAGSHESIADTLGLPRATYFRLYQQAIVRLGQALFE